MNLGARRVVSLLALAAVVWVSAGGCVERTITVRSEPPGARVYLDDVERGETPCTFSFDFYGQRELLLRKDGYEPAREVIEVKPPLYSAFPLDFFFDLVWPFTIEENHTYDVVLQPLTKPDPQKLIFRARQLREKLQSPR